MIDPIPLFEAALVASKNAHAPYSNYHVGAALLCEDGTIVSGCNVENASYGLTNCAERTAIFSAVSSAKKNFKAIAIISQDGPLPYPCGACRQVLAEFCDPTLPVFVGNETTFATSFKTVTLGDLLPYPFG